LDCQSKPALRKNYEMYAMRGFGFAKAVRQKCSDPKGSNDVARALCCR